MENKDETIIALNLARTKLDDAKKQLDNIQQQHDHWSFIVATLEADIGPAHDLKAPSFVDVSEAKTPQDFDLSGINIDLTRGKQMVDKFFLLCEAASTHNKLISLTDVAQFFLDHGLSQATPRNMKGTLSHFIADHKDFFQQIRPGLYHYIPEAEQNLMTVDSSDDKEHSLK